MEDNEGILDSGEIYKELDPLELPIQKDEPLDWSRLSKSVNPGGRAWKTHHLLALNKNVLWFIPSVFVWFIGLIPLFVDAILFFFLVLLSQEIYLTQDWALLGPFLFLLLLFVLLFMFGAKYFMLHPIAIFNKRKGLFKKRKENFDDFERINLIHILMKEKVSAELGEVMAIQLLKEKVGKKKDLEFISYEINLVLNDGHRINVVNHGNEKAVIKQAKRLATFLGVELYAAKDIKA